MILILSAGGGNQEGAFGPFLDFSRDGRGRFAARRGTEDGGPRSAACFFWKCLLSGLPRSGIAGGRAAAAAGRGRALRCAPGGGLLLFRGAKRRCIPCPFVGADACIGPQIGTPGARVGGGLCPAPPGVAAHSDDRVGADLCVRPFTRICLLSPIAASGPTAVPARIRSFPGPRHGRTHRSAPT